MRVKPFTPQNGWTVFDNVIIDHIMPTLTPNGWKCLTLIIRKTIGWHKEADELSFSQIKAGTGIKHSQTIIDALGHLEEKGILNVSRFDDQWRSNIYSLNLDLEIEVASSAENEPGSSAENEHTKETVNKKKQTHGA